MKFCRINLSKTNYPLNTLKWHHLTRCIQTIDYCNEIYQKYCAYKQFNSVMPIFDSQYQDRYTDLLGYYYNNELVAFSLIKKYDTDNAECIQFAWDYANPDLTLGIKSLKNECALYKSLGFKYLYLGQAAEYKSQIDGYEIVRKLDV